MPSDTLWTGDVLETVVTDEDVQRAHDNGDVGEIVENLCAETQKFSKAVMTMYRRMKRGSCKENNARARRIVEDLRVKREAMRDDKAVVAVGQSTLFDFGE